MEDYAILRLHHAVHDHVVEAYSLRALDPLPEKEVHLADLVLQGENLLTGWQRLELSLLGKGLIMFDLEGASTAEQETS